MTEKPTFCPVCKRMQVGVHGKDHAIPALLPMKTLTVEEAKEMFPPTPKFDKRAYQREYMRKRRARDKA